MTTLTPLQIAQRGCLKLRVYFEENYENVSLDFVNEHFEVLLQALSEHDGHLEFTKSVALTVEARKKARRLVARVERHTKPQAEYNFSLVELENEIKILVQTLHALRKRHAELSGKHTVGLTDYSKKVLRSAIARHTYWDSRFKVDESICAGESDARGMNH